VRSFHHKDKEDSAFVPAAEPADSPIIDTIAQRHRLAKAVFSFSFAALSFTNPATNRYR